MEAAKFEFDINDRPAIADIVALDIKGQIVMLVEIKAQLPEHKGIAGLTFKLQAANFLIPFAMLVDLKNINIFQWNGANLSETICELKTDAILSHYDPGFSSKRIFWDYLKTLVSAWMRDLAYHWKSETPPGSEQLAAIGLLQRLAGGTTRDEVVLRGNVDDADTIC